MPEVYFQGDERIHEDLTCVEAPDWIQRKELLRLLGDGWDWCDDCTDRAFAPATATLEHLSANPKTTLRNLDPELPVVQEDLRYLKKKHSPRRVSMNILQIYE